MLSGNMLKVLQMLTERDMTFRELKKSTRMSEKMLESVVNSLKDRDYIEDDGEKLKITENGKEVIKKTQL